MGKFRLFKKLLRKGKVTDLDDVVLEGYPDGYEILDESSLENLELPNDEQESCDDISSDGELVRKDSKYPRFKKGTNSPKFTKFLHDTKLFIKITHI